MEKLLEEIKETLKDEKETARTLPFIAVRGQVVFPHTTVYLDIAREKSLSSLQRAMMADQRAVLTAQKDASVEEPTFDELFEVGCTVKVRHIVPCEEEETVRLVCEGEERVLLTGLTRKGGCDFAEFLPLPLEEEEDSDLIEGCAQRVKSLFAELCHARGRAPGEQLQIIEGESNPRVLADLAAGALKRVEDKQKLLEARNLTARYTLLVKLMQREIELAHLEREIDQTVRERMTQQQREYYLREQLHVIHEELGDGSESESERLRKLVAAKTAMPKEAREKAERELGRLSRMQQGTPEATVAQTYVEWLAEMPWGKYTKAQATLPAARKVLESEHYGLEKVKERIVEFLAVRTTAQDQMRAPILCLVGPPGVGKTSIAQSVAHALKRKFIRVALGGVHDEAELRGHRRTYIGAQPGRIAASIRQCGVMNPVFLFDEIDKMASDYKGDPASAMLEVLDPAQNGTFTDHFLDVPLDLSQVLFLTTANSAEDIPQPLYDRMEIVEVPSYTLEEKVQIAKRHLWPRQLKEHGLKKSQLSLTDGALTAIAESYTREAGVRDLERKLGAICRKAVVRRLDEGEEAGRLTVKEDNLESYLGAPRFLRDKAPGEPEVGLVNGLAWTQAGGTVMPVEATSMPGAGKVDLTGRLGEVMQESARAAISYIRSHAEELGVPAGFYKERDLHVHLPEGAVPKDGPSAGVALTSALVSCLSGRPARQDVAMTGEITLRGRVLPIGGVKEKLLAAHRLGVETVLLPQGNEKDLAELPQNVRDQMDIHLIDHVSQALSLVLTGGPA